jgi:thioester reductase-like protein
MTSFEKKKTLILQQAAEKIVQLKKELAQAELNNHDHEPLAVIGVGCEFPGNSHSAEAYWRNLEKGFDAICKVPQDRWDADAFFSSNLDALGKINSKQGGFLTSDVALFDAPFFGINPKEAESMDPQQRLALEVTWQALEHAAINPQSLKGSSSGIYMGSSTNDYGYLFAKHVPDEQFNPYFCSGNSSSVIAGRIAYILGTQGPAIACDTSCSSSLVAVHLACKALVTGEVDLAIAGGVNLILSPHNSICFSKAHMLSEDGHCKTFDYRANGYARGEGCGVIIIKRLSDALKAKDNVICIIKSSVVNQDGASSGLTTPNPKAQEHVIKQALKNAKLRPNDIDVIEAHGTGTALGDPIEMEAISNVFRGRELPLHIGSVKTNMGHLEGAAGIAGMIKMILSLQNRTIPKHLNFTEINPLIDLVKFKGNIPTENQNWPQEENKIRRAGVSSFGLNGTNAHVILEEAPEQTPMTYTSCDSYLFCFSAKSSETLSAQLNAFAMFLDTSIIEALHPVDVSFTLNTGRAQFESRVAIIAVSLHDLKHKINSKAFLQPNDLVSKTTLEAEKAEEFLQGEHVNFDKLYLCPTKKVVLPGYVFQKKRYWATHASSSNSPSFNARIHPFLRNHVESHRHHEALFTTLISNTYPSYVLDYKLYDTAVLADASFVSMLISYVLQTLKKESGTFSDIVFLQPLIIHNKAFPYLQLIVNKACDVFEIISYKDKGLTNLTVHATGKFVSTPWQSKPLVEIEALRKSLHNEYLSLDLTKKAQSLGLDLGPHFDWIKQISYHDSEILATLRHPAMHEKEGYDFYPGLLDAAFQTMLVWTEFDPSKSHVQLPKTIDKLSFQRCTSSPCYISVKKIKHNKAHIEFLDVNGDMIIDMGLITLKPLAETDFRGMQEQQYKNLTPAYAIDWHEKNPDPFNEVEAKTQDFRLLVISPEEHDFTQLKTCLLPMNIHVSKKLPIATSLKHALYIYPENDDGNLTDSIVQLHACIQKLTNMPLIESIGVMINHSLSHSMVSGYWNTLRIEYPEKNIYFIESSFEHSRLLGIIIKAQCYRIAEENHVAIRNGVYFVPRLTHIEQQAPLLAKINHDDSFRYSKTGTYLITGGLGGLGRILINHLINQNVKHLVLLSRRSTDVLPDWLTTLQKSDVNIQYYSINVTHTKTIKTIIDTINNSSAPLAGIFHLAGRLMDKSIARLGQIDFEQSFEAKVEGALALHEASKSLDLDCFVMFSSIAASFGSPGQANYAAANSFMDSLCLQRQAAGLAALSINWGPFGDSGMAIQHLSKLRAIGLLPLKKFDAFARMDYLLLKPYAHVIVADLNWNRITAITKNAKFLSMLNNEIEDGEVSFLAVLEKAPKAERAALLMLELKVIVATVLSIDDVDDLHEHKEFMEFGVDSLMTINLWNRLQSMVGVEQSLSTTLLLECTTISMLSEYFKESIFSDLFDHDMKETNNAYPMASIPALNFLNGDIAIHPTPSKRHSDGMVTDIFLTGGTGALGGYLVKLMLEQTTVTLHCLVRASNSKHGLQRIRKRLEGYKINLDALEQLEARVNIYCGDVTCDSFSLPAETYAHVAHITDLSIHAAARLSLRESFEELYDTNVVGTKNVIKFSLKTHSKSLLYVSSYAVMGDIYIGEKQPFKETDFDLGQEFDDMGYQKTKFESERMIRASEHDGLTWRIVRPGDLFGDAETGAYPLDSENAPSIFYDLLKTVIETNVAALSPLYFDLTPVDYVAKAILHIVFKQEEPYVTYHLTNPDVKHLPEVIHLLRDLGYPIELISADAYIKRVYTHQLKHDGKVYQSLTTSMIQYKASKIIPEHSTHVDATWTSSLLLKAGIQCPKVDKKLLHTFISYCIDEGYISAKISQKEDVIETLG